MPDTQRVPNTRLPPVGANNERARVRMSPRFKEQPAIEIEKGSPLQAGEKVWGFRCPRPEDFALKWGSFRFRPTHEDRKANGSVDLDNLGLTPQFTCGIVLVTGHSILPDTG